MTTPERVHDPTRLERAFADRGLDWLVERIRQRLERGAGLAGSVSLRDPTPEQQAAHARLFGVPQHGARVLTVRLPELTALLHNAGLCDDLAAAIEHLGGPTVDRRAGRARAEAAWSELFRAALVEASADERRYLEELRATGLLRRLCPAPIADAEALLARSLRVARRLPLTRPTPLAKFAADVLGDSHALDHGEAAHVLALRFLAVRTGIAGWDSRDARREAWAQVNVIVDELSAPVLVLGLRARGDGFTARTLQLHADAWEPCRISTRQLLRERLDWQAPPHVFVCENPAIIAAAASWLATPCAPLICVEGQPTTAARLLLGQLDAAGSTLHYHGDFDWPGVTIANFILRTHGARAWRMFAADYLAADDLQGARLRGAVVEATWDPELAAAMQARGLAVHEEQVVEQLLADLASRADAVP